MIVYPFFKQLIKDKINHTYFQQDNAHCSYIHGTSAQYVQWFTFKFDHRFHAILLLLNFICGME